MEEILKIIKNEYVYYNLFRVVIPFVIMLCVVVILIGYSDNITLVVLSIFLPMTYPFAFLFTAERGALWSLGMKFGYFPTKFFNKISYPRATLRFKNIKKLLHQTIYAAIISAVILSTTLLTIYFIEDNDSKQFENKQAIHLKELKTYSLLHDDKLTSYFKIQVINFDQFNLRENAFFLLNNEIKQKGKLTNNSTMIEKSLSEAIRILNNMTEYQISRMLFLKVDDLSQEDLRELIEKNLDILQPAPLSAIIPFQLFIFLTTLLTLPLAMLYSIGVFVWGYNQKIEYHINFARGCFEIANKLPDTHRPSKQKYMIMGINSYDEFMKKTINMQIQNIDKIHSSMARYTIPRINNTAYNFVEILQRSDKFELLDIIRQKYNVGPTMLVKDPALKKIKNITSFAGPAIPVIVVAILEVITRFLV